MMYSNKLNVVASYSFYTAFHYIIPITSLEIVAAIK